MTAVVAVLAGIVALQYLLIAVIVVPRLARLTDAPGRAITVAAYGAAAFFVGCAITHTGIAINALTQSMDQTMAHPLLVHVLPHIAQVAGGAVFILIGTRRLDIRLAAKDTAIRLRNAEARFRAAFEQAATGIAVVSLAPNHAGLLLQANPAFGAMLGRDEDDLQGTDLTDLGRPDRAQALRQALIRAGDPSLPPAPMEHRFLHRDGREVRATLQIAPVLEEDGGAAYGIAQIREVTEQRESEERLRHLTDHDALTGLFNRARFESDLARTVGRARRDRAPATLLVLDLDHFTLVNNALGHATGDDVLRRCAQVISSRAGDGAVVARLGGDEFGVLLPATADGDGTAVAVLEGLRSDRPVVVAGGDVRVTASIGTAPIDPGEPRESDELLVVGDAAVFAAKQGGGDRVVPAGSEAALAAFATHRTRAGWSVRIRHALEHDRLLLLEQPVIPLRAGLEQRTEFVVGLNGDADGPHPAPDEFHAAAERFGQTQAIDHWVIVRAIGVLSARHRAGEDHVVHVRLSARSVADDAFADFLVQLVSGAAIDPGCLVLELTEAHAMAALAQAPWIAGRLASTGCGLTLTDFGAAFSSFGSLERLPFDAVKLADDLTRDLGRSATDRLAIDAIVRVAQGLGMSTVAGRVGDEAAVDLLAGLGVDYAAGPHFGAPTKVPDPRMRRHVTPGRAPRGGG